MGLPLPPPVAITMLPYARTHRSSRYLISAQLRSSHHLRHCRPPTSHAPWSGCCSPPWMPAQAATRHRQGWQRGRLPAQPWAPARRVPSPARQAPTVSKLPAARQQPVRDPCCRLLPISSATSQRSARMAWLPSAAAAARTWQPATSAVAALALLVLLCLLQTLYRSMVCQPELLQHRILQMAVQRLGTSSSVPKLLMRTRQAKVAVITA